MRKILGSYVNGNYTVTVLTNGTKIRTTNDDDFMPAFAENCDLKITDKCDGGCQFCYEGCSINGKHGDILNAKFIDTLHPFTELALNGNDLSHPDLIPFLKKLQAKQIITNMTVNQKHFIQHYDFIKSLIDDNLIFGLGISLVNVTDEFLDKVKSIDNSVIHVINGIFTKEQAEQLKGHNLKLLVLGYKELNRGIDYLSQNNVSVRTNQKWLYDNIDTIASYFKIMSYDNLALEQLNVKRFMSEEDWNTFYMGDDGTMTFYIDLVEGKFAKNSISLERFNILDNIDDMFNIIAR